jgi:hypothetical protein
LQCTDLLEGECRQKTSWHCPAKANENDRLEITRLEQEEIGAFSVSSLTCLGNSSSTISFWRRIRPGIFFCEQKNKKLRLRKLKLETESTYLLTIGRGSGGLFLLLLFLGDGLDLLLIHRAEERNKARKEEVKSRAKEKKS